MYGFTFNGIHSDTYGIIMRSRNRQALPAANDSYLQIPGRHGSYLFPGELEDREIEVSCYLPQDALENLRSTIHQVAAWLHTTERKTLEFDDEPGKYYMAKVSGTIDPDQAATDGQFDIEFRCEPLAYGPEQQVDFVAVAVTVANPGTFEALPTFTATFTAAATEWKVTLGAKYVRVVRAFQTGDVLEVNCSTGAVLVNGLRDLASFDWQNSEFFALAPGDNDLTVTPAGVSDTSIAFAPRWL